MKKNKVVSEVNNTEGIISTQLDRSLFTYQFTYDCCLKKGMTNSQWLRIKEDFKNRNNNQSKKLFCKQNMKLVKKELDKLKVSSSLQTSSVSQNIRT